MYFILINLIVLSFNVQRSLNIDNNLEFSQEIDLHNFNYTQGYNYSRSHILWQLFKTKYGKTYLSKEEESYRFKIFTLNLEVIKRHNVAYIKGLTTFKIGINAFADKLKNELRYLRGFNYSMQKLNLNLPRIRYHPLLGSVILPGQIDWREHNLVTPVKNQGQCGSCWAFSTTGSVEGQYARVNKKLESFSEQQLVDCSFENDGCGGGIMNLAFKYIIEAGGITTEEQYPYVSGTPSMRDNICLYKPKMKVASITGFVEIETGDEKSLLESVATQGPVSVAIDAEGYFMAYDSGIYDGSECSKTDPQLNHGVLVVGYGEESGKPYWIVKNSWGDDWGEKGYIKMLRGKNICGISNMASFPTI